MHKSKPGRPPALTGDLAFLTAFALGRGLDLREVAHTVGVSSSTVLRFFNSGTLATDPQCQRLMRLISEHDERPDDAHNQNPHAYDSDIDAF